MANLIDGWKFEVREGSWCGAFSDAPTVTVSVADGGDALFVECNGYGYTVHFAVIDELRKRQKHGEEDG